MGSGENKTIPNGTELCVECPPMGTCDATLKADINGNIYGLAVTNGDVACAPCLKGPVFKR